MIDLGKLGKQTCKLRDGLAVDFGLDPLKIAAALRVLAGKVESGQLSVRRLQTGAVASHDEFPTTGLFMEFEESYEAPDTPRTRARVIDLP